jgi:hypothetical protein
MAMLTKPVHELCSDEAAASNNYNFISHSPLDIDHIIAIDVSEECL